MKQLRGMRFFLRQRVARDDEELTLQIPSDGTVPTLRAVLDILDGAGVTPEALSQHTPDLDEVFLTLTGDKQQETSR